MKAADTTAAELAAGSPLDAALDNTLILGLFLPLQEGAWSPSSAPRETSWTYEYNAQCAVEAERYGFDLAFGLGQWLAKGGYGGQTHFREHELDPLISSAALAERTRKLLLISTVHVLYGWHPVHLAKYGACLDHISGGRWGLNVVTGYKQSEYRMFGLDPIEHDLRYSMAAEFTGMLQTLWGSDDNVTLQGVHWSMTDAHVLPKPLHGRPVLVNAASSPAGLEYAAQNSDLVFITSPGGADPHRAVEALPAYNAKIKAFARAKGREVRTIINPHVICRETEKEAWAAYQAILDNEDPVAAENFAAAVTGGDGRSWRGHSREQWVVGGNVHLVGTPEQIVEWFVRLHEAGCDGVQVNFFDYLPDLRRFGEQVVPLMVEAGLREAAS
ncbi:LLM class flavin-dependent oxidoreductase [Pseudonocardia xishanensis]|uniref:LLM class flavin-dependent oxidoreductase n=1 Tax=Pseudonocardia xishanensis TaxID=630995 RepID=A0ABP8REW0_9PSEU